MSVKIYREINNNTLKERDKNILLQFICEVDLWNAESIFDCCLHYDESEEEYCEISETYYTTLKKAIEYLKYLINRESDTNDTWYKEATRCYDILVKVMNECEENEFFILFVC